LSIQEAFSKTQIANEKGDMNLQEDIAPERIEVKVPVRLYRYRNLGLEFELTQREIDTIKLQYVWASDYQNLNDPMEGLYRPNINRSKSVYQETIRKIFNQKRASSGISCFSETNDNELMWAHYAENYAGLCVEYSGGVIEQGQNTNHGWVRVIYGDEPPQFNAEQLMNYVQAARTILSHKKSSWAYEREWRLVGPTGKTVFSNQPVRAIYFGSRTPAHVRLNFIAQLQETGIEFFNVVISGYKHEWTKTSIQNESIEQGNDEYKSPNIFPA
jgi:hypothetical protein